MSALTDAIGAALIHSLWENSIVAIGLWAALAALRHRSPNARYAASCAALGLMAVLPMLTTGVLYLRTLPADGVSPATAGTARTIVEDAQALTAVWIGTGIHQTAWMARLQQWALPLWSVGVLLFSLRPVCGGAHAIALKRHSKPAHEAMFAVVARVGRHLGVRRPVRVVISPLTHGPATLGWLRPVILLPPATAMGLTPQQLEAVLAHELAHIRRHDYVANILQMVVETLFFYHPAIWWASRRIRVERELCCDDLAVTSCGDALCYAQALTTLARLRVTMPSMAVGATGGPLLHRIQRLLGASTQEHGPSPWPAVLAVCLVLACGALNANWIRAHAQGDDANAVVSGLWEIRPAAAGSVRLSMCYADASSRSEIPVSHLDGFSPAWLRQDGPIPFFTLRRDAGIFSFEGAIQSGVGLGTYKFEPAASFPVDLGKRGFGPPTFAQQAKWPGLGTWTHSLALYDIGFPFFDELRAQGVLHPDYPQIVQWAQIHPQIEEGLRVRAAADTYRRWC